MKNEGVENRLQDIKWDSVWEKYINSLMIMINRIYYILFDLQFRIKSKTNNTDYGPKTKLVFL